MKNKEFLCPKCGSECWRDEVDNGVVTQYGPWKCNNCGWLEWPYLESHAWAIEVEDE